MAEILLSLTIIGVVAAITLPSLTGNINERTWNTQRKALYARMSQAIALMPALNGYGTLVEGNDSTSAQDTAAETFITSGLSKVLKINNICDSEHWVDCGLPSKVTALDGTEAFSQFPKTLFDLNASLTSVAFPGWEYSQVNTKMAAFETQNGESIAAFYNPNCIFDIKSTDDSTPEDRKTFFMQPNICVNFIYDLNGNKGPNTVGKDIGFLTVLYPTDSVVVAPMPLNRPAGTASHTGASALCRKQDVNSRLANREEWVSIFVNQKLLNLQQDTRYWTSTVETATTAYYQSLFTGTQNTDSRNAIYIIRCIKR